MWKLQKGHHEKTRVDYWAKLSRNNQNVYSTSRLLPMPIRCTVTRFVSISSKFGICTVVGLKGALVEAKIRTLDTTMCVI
jgi:hypothetical protein